MIPNKIIIKVIRHKFITLNIHYTKNNNGKVWTGIESIKQLHATLSITLEKVVHTRLIH